MLRLFHASLAVWVFVAVAPPSHAFSLLGPFNDFWQVTRLGYIGCGLNASIADLGGPMNLGEEYRWNVPNIYYAVDRTFLDYFGQRGSEEIDKAVTMLNALPRMSEINIDSFPLQAERVNAQARALGIMDLKSYALAGVLSQLGLASPSRWVFTLRERFITPAPTTNYIMIKRNFDPASWRPTSYINGELWTYLGFIEDDTCTWVINQRVDPLGFNVPVADVVNGGYAEYTVGSYFTGLTRDDVGALHYIYRPENFNNENPLTTVFGAGGTVTIPGVPGGSTTSPWTPLPSPANTNVTGPGISVPGTNTVFVPVFIPNQTNGTVAPTNVGPIVITNAFIATATRAGIDKVNLIRVQFDSLLGQFIAPVLDSFSDTIITNSANFSQTLQRIVFRPDIVFKAGDLFGDPAGAAFVVLGNGLMLIGPADGNPAWVNNLALNSEPPVSATDSGPGVIGPPVSITFNKVGPAFFNGPWPFNLSEEESSIISVVWGSFDGSTNAPVVYPNNVTIEDLERRVLGQ